MPAFLVCAVFTRKIFSPTAITIIAATAMPMTKGAGFKFDPEEPSEYQQVQENGHDGHPCYRPYLLAHIAKQAPVNGNIHDKIKHNARCRDPREVKKTR